MLHQPLKGDQPKLEKKVWFWLIAKLSGLSIGIAVPAQRPLFFLLSQLNGKCLHPICAIQIIIKALTQRMIGQNARFVG